MVTAIKYYLVDSENVNDNWLMLFDMIDETDNIIVFYTKNSPHMSYPSVIRLLKINRTIKFEECFEGNNALDLLQKLTDKYGMYEAASESGQTETFDGFNFQYVMIDELTRLTLYSEIHKYSECSITLVYVDKELRKIVESKFSDDL